jgi:hypothetical protein
MKHTTLLLFFLSAIVATAQEHKLEKLWETDSVIAIPESVLPHGNTLYVSLIDGEPWGADGKGGIATLDADGKNYKADWITGLHAPKGMGIYKNKLYVADISDVVVINIKKGKIEKRIAIDSATGLNDITITDNGIVYVSDSRTARIWRIEKDAPSLYLENMQGVNGLKAAGNELIIASGKSFVKADAEKKIIPIAETAQGGDGIEPVGNGDYIVSAWAGYIWYVTADGKVQSLLETHPQKRNTADIGYDPVKKIVYVPTFFSKTVAAYQLK